MLDVVSDFLRQPEVAQMFENFLSERQLLKQCEDRANRAPVTVEIVPLTDQHIQETLANKRSTIDAYLKSQTPTPPAKGKKLGVVDAFHWLLDHESAFNVVKEEFFSQVSKDELDPDGCWILKDHIRVYRNSKGALKKMAQIHYFAKPFGSVQLAYFLTNREIPEKNLYPNCSNDRCVNPEHHNEGRKGKLKKRITFRQDVKQEAIREFMEDIVSHLELNPEQGAEALLLQTKFVTSKIMTLQEYTEALKLGQAYNKFHFRRQDGRVYLNGYPSVNRVAAAGRALDRLSE